MKLSIKQTSPVAPGKTLQLNTTPTVSNIGTNIKNVSKTLNVSKKVGIQGFESVNTPKEFEGGFDQVEKPKIKLTIKNTNDNKPYEGPSAGDTKMYDQRTHVYMKPDMYIGSDTPVERHTWLYNLEEGKMYKEMINLVPGLERIFLEILSNAADNANMSRRKGVDPGKIDITMNNSTISITNYGAPMPVEIHPELEEEKIYIPEISFGRLLTSRHYETDRHEAGTNGVGSKATNIYSKNFTVVVQDHVRHKKYTQTWTENMIYCHNPDIVPYNGKVSSVQVIYLADFARFNYEVPNGEIGGYEPEAFALFARHALDVSLNSKIAVTFNGIAFNLSDIREYGRLCFGDIVDNGVIHYQWPAGTEIVKKKKGGQKSKDPSILPEIELLALDTPDEGGHISFTNGIMNFDGGVHTNAAFKAVGDSTVKMINDNIIKKLTKGKKGKELDAKEKRANTINISDVKPHISIILSAKLVNPKFTSQEKSCLHTPTPKIAIDDNELKAIGRWELIERLYAAIEAKQYNNISKGEGKTKGRVRTKNGMEANQAGKAERHKCMLYITEGNSGNSYAKYLTTLTPGGRDYIGTLPLRGKCLNVMNADMFQIDNNREFTALKKMLGLRQGVDYTIEDNYRTLKYGAGVMVMADADVDGKHIVGLILNFFHWCFPSLLAVGYLKDYLTPIVSVTKANNTLKFYSDVGYNNWKDTTPDYSKWKHKYYKGLGSSKNIDIKANYADPRTVGWFYDMDAPDKFSLVFKTGREDDRKEWISRWQPLKDEFRHEQQPISWYLDHELILHCLDNINRTIPGVLDGLKESQRKIMYAAMLKWKFWSKTKAYDELKIAQLIGFVADKSSYHHSENILGDTIVGMSQDYIGSNNISYFVKGGQLGTRHELGKDAAQTRYTCTEPKPLLSLLYSKKDAAILDHLQDEGKMIEPDRYLPIIPMILVNGTSSIATAWSSNIPCFNPLDLIRWLKMRLQDSTNLIRLNPWYRGFTGVIEVIDRSKKGVKTVLQPTEDTAENGKEVELKEGDDDVDEEELPEEFEEEDEPVGRQLLSMKIYGKFEIRHNGDIIITEMPIGRSPFKYHKWLETLIETKKIKDFRDLSGDDVVYFEIYGYVGTPSYKTLKLERNVGMSNMVALDEHNKPVRYDSAAEIAEKFYQLRLPYFQKRKDYMIKALTEEITTMHYKMKFNNAVNVTKEIVIINGDEDEIHTKMDILGIPHKIYDGSMRSINKRQVEVLAKSIAAKEQERTIIEQTSIKAMMLSELEAFEQAYRKEYKIKDETVKLNLKGGNKIGNTIIASYKPPSPTISNFPTNGTGSKQINKPVSNKYNVPKEKVKRVVKPKVVVPQVNDAPQGVIIPIVNQVNVPKTLSLKINKV